MAFFTQDRTGRRKWCLVQGEQICHPISQRSSILFSPPFLCSLCLLLILAPSTQPKSASHPFSPILPSLTFCTHPDPSLYLSPLLFYSSLSFIRFLSPSLYTLSVKGWGGGVAGVERDEFLIAVWQHRALSLVRESREERQKLEKKKENYFFSLAAYDRNCPPPSLLCFPLSRAAAGYNLNHQSQLCRLACPRLTNDLLPRLHLLTICKLPLGSKMR